MALIDLSHVVEAGMSTYPGLPGPVICDFLSREASRAKYAPGTEFQIGKIELVANTGTYVDSPFHRYAEGTDLAGLRLDQLADLETIVASSDATAIGPELFEGLDLHGKGLARPHRLVPSLRHPAVRHGHPYLTGPAAELLVSAGVAFVGIDSLNIDGMADGTRPVHTTLLGAGIPIGEHFTNIAALPSSGARLHTAPVKVKGFGTFPVRAYAIV